jgi:hypothetical protein
VNSVLAFAVLAVVLIAGCRQTPPAPPSPPRTELAPTFAALRADGDARLAAKDWAGAALAYDQALVYQPSSVPVRYGRAIALSYLDRRDEAVTAFLWVVDNAPLTSEESRVARQWLVSAGVRTMPAPKIPVPQPAVSEGAEAVRPGGRVKGKTQWTELERGAQRLTLQILMEGDEAVTEGRYYGTRVRLNEPYEIAGISPGRYRLSAQVGPIRLWDTRIVVNEGTPAVLDLTPATSIAPANALRPGGAP